MLPKHLHMIRPLIYLNLYLCLSSLISIYLNLYLHRLIVLIFFESDSTAGVVVVTLLGDSMVKQLMKGQKTVSQCQCILGKKVEEKECLTYIFFHEIDRSVSIGHSISNYTTLKEDRAALKACEILKIKNDRD